MSAKAAPNVDGNEIQQFTPDQALTLDWTLGQSTDTVLSSNSIIDLSDTHLKAIFYASAHTGVIYDYINKTQRLLQGHSNDISAIAASPDHRWIVTADKGDQSVIIVWDTKSVTNRNYSIYPVPIKVIYDAHHGPGVTGISFTSDSKYLITLGSTEASEQTIQIWNWSTESSEPIHTYKIGEEQQLILATNPSDPFEFMTNSKRSVFFYTWDLDKGVTKHKPILSEEDFGVTLGDFTTSNFLPRANYAATGTSDGALIIWTNHALTRLTEPLKRGEKAAIKVISHVHRGPINHVSVLDINPKVASAALSPPGQEMAKISPTSPVAQFYITAAEDGQIKVWNMEFKLFAWFDHLNCGPIASVSHSATNVTTQNLLPDLIVNTKQGKIALVSYKNPKFSDAALSVINQSLKDASVVDQRVIALPFEVAGKYCSDYSTKNELVFCKLLEHQYGTIHALVTHPRLHLLALGGQTGQLLIIDYLARKIARQVQLLEPDSTFVQNTKKTLVQPFVPMAIECLAYSHDGSVIAVGFGNGKIQILNSATLKPHHSRYDYGYEASNAPIKRLAFSPDDKYLAFADGNFAVGLLNDVDLEAAHSGLIIVKNKSEWQIIGKNVAHYKSVCSLIFHFGKSSTDATGELRLFSIAEDRHCVEYDLKHSSAAKGFKTKYTKKIEQSERPLSAILMSNIDQVHHEDLFLVANSGLKLRSFNMDTQSSRQTALGPSFGGTVAQMIFMPPYTPAREDEDEVHEEGSRKFEDHINPKYMAFSTHEKSIGLLTFPLTGNPYSTMGVIAHPTGVSQIARSYDGAYLLSAGGSDAVVNTWSVRTDVLEAQLALEGRGIEPFLEVVDPSGLGKQGPFYKEIEDYFLYAQLREQGEASGTSRRIEESVPVTQAPLIMQAMGYYPSAQEIDDMLNEVKYRHFLSATGKLADQLTLDELIQLYINYKPVKDLTLEEISQALAFAKNLDLGTARDETAKHLGPTEKLSKSALRSLLQKFGESMAAEEFDDMMDLLGKTESGDDSSAVKLPDQFSAKHFVQNYLGLLPALPGSLEPEPVLFTGASPTTDSPSYSSPNRANPLLAIIQASLPSPSISTSPRRSSS